MKALSHNLGHRRGHAARQRGVVLFFALIALVVMSLAAVALIRSVDTSTMIAGNLAFKQSATTSADGGVESAVTAVNAAQAAMTAIKQSVLIDPNCPSACSNVLNATNAANGYYSSLTDPALTSNLTDSANWVNASSKLVGTDQSGNEMRYIIQRMCRTANQPPSTTNCLFSSATLDNNGMEVPLPSTVCQGSGCPVAGQAPEYRITGRAAGPGNTFSYVQAFVY
jgi:type IV pilus assembly protein PilX